MARPKKNRNTPEARQRMIDSAWELLEQYRYDQITVSMIVKRAGCNRGTFYYHFNGIDDLMVVAVEEEILGDSSLIVDCLNILSGVDTDAVNDVLAKDRLQHVFLAVRQGATEQVSRSVKSVVLDMWQTILRPDGGELEQDARMIVEYTTSGMLGVLSYHEGMLAKGEDVHFSPERISELSSFMLSEISKTEGISVEDIITRLKVLTQFSKISKS